MGEEREGIGSGGERERLKPGPVPAYLDDAQRTELLTLVSLGRGVNSAIAQMGINWRVLDRTRKADPEFAAEIKEAQLRCHQDLVFIRTAQARSGDPRALDFLIARYDNDRQFEANMRFKRWESRQAAQRGGQTVGPVDVRVTYDEPDARLHRTPDNPLAPPASGPEAGD